MERRRVCGIAALALTTAAVLACAGYGLEAEVSPGPLPEEQADSAEIRQILRDHFAARYREAECSSIYADVTGDGREELLVVELEPDPAGEAILLHGDAVDMDQFTRGRVTVLGAEGGAVSALYTFTCGADPTEWGGLYLIKWEGETCLAACVPGRETSCFSLEADGTVVQHPAEMLLLQAKPLLVYDEESQSFAYLDELFTSY